MSGTQGELSIELAEPEISAEDIERLVAVLGQWESARKPVEPGDRLRPAGWLTAAEIGAKLDASDRFVRKAASAARPAVVSYPGSPGYKLWQLCTIEEINHCIEAIESQLAADYAGLGYTFEMALAPLPPIAFRPVGMQRLLMNLMHNAATHGRTGLAIRTWTEPGHVALAVRAGLGRQVAGVGRRQVQFGAHQLGDGDTEFGQLSGLVLVVAEQGDARGAEGAEHLCGDGVVALVLGVHRLMSQALTPTNLIGNGIATLVIAKWERALDERRLREALDGN